MPSKRALRRRERSQRRRAEAEARTPQMRDQEEALRQQVNTLLRTAEAVGKHAHYDREIKTRTERYQALATSSASLASSSPKPSSGCMSRYEAALAADLAFQL